MKNPVRTAQPAVRAVRYDNPRAARAEEGIVALCMYNLSLVSKLPPDIDEAFTVPLYKKVLETLKAYEKDDQKSVSINSFSKTLSDEEMSQLAAVIETTPTGSAVTALTDYLRIIDEEKQKKAPGMSLEELIQAKKDFGG